MSFPKNPPSSSDAFAGMDCLQLVGHFQTSQDGNIIVELLQLVEGPEMRLSRLIYKYISDKELVKDFINDLYLKLYRELKVVQIYTNCKGWIYKLVRNEAINFSRKALNRYRSNEVPDIPEKPTSTSPGDQIDLRELIDKIKAHLTPEEWTYLELFYVQGLSMKECADQLSLFVNQFRGRLERTRSKVNTKFGLEWMQLIEG